MNPQQYLAPICRWEEQNKISKFFHPTKQNFGINRRADANTPIEINFGPVHLRWQDGSWTNLNLPEQPANPNPTLQEISKLQRENAQLQVECEILLHMLTVSEMKKVKSQNKLTSLKNQISAILEQIEKEEQSQE